MVNVVLDANCWCARVDETLLGAAGPGTGAFEKAYQIGKVVIDDGGHIKQQYTESRRGFGEQLFNIFFEDGVLSGKIHLVPSGGSGNLRRRLLAAGLPRKELPYFYAAAASKAGYIVSNDIDFFDPTLKRANEAAKARAKARRNGCVCRLARDEIGCEIYCMDGFLAAA